MAEGYDALEEYFIAIASKINFRPCKSLYMFVDEAGTLLSNEFSFITDISEALYNISMNSAGVRSNTSVSMFFCKQLQIDSKRIMEKNLKKDLITFILYAINPENFGDNLSGYEDILKCDCSGMTRYDYDEDKQMVIYQLNFEVQFKIANGALKL